MRYERIGPESTLWRKWDPRLENWALVYSPDDSRGPPPRAVYEDLEHWRYYADDFPKQGQAATWETADPPGISSDAIVVRDLILRLEPEYELALVAWYRWRGPLEVRVAQLGIHPDTLRNRVGYAMQDLERLEGARKRGEALPIARKQQVATLE